jgi:flagellar hook-basal body complex protein FliE
MEEFNILQSIISAPFELKTNFSPVKRDPLMDFKEILNKSIDKLNRELLRADQMAQDMMLGKIDVHQAMIAIEQAHLSLRLMIQIRNKIIAAYEEIMRIQF